MMFLFHEILWLEKYALSSFYGRTDKTPGSKCLAGNNEIENRYEERSDNTWDRSPGHHSREM
jgi:hypothetical protein